MTSERHEKLIAETPLLARLPAEDLRALASHGRVTAYPAGAAIFDEGDPGDALYIVIEGALRVAVISPDGEEATLAMLGPGESCGELSLLDGRRRSASAIAARASRLLIVQRQDFIEWLAARPQAALALLETLSLRMRHLDEAFSDLAFLDLPQRLAKRLLDLAAEPAQAADGDRRLKITQAELASMLGVSRESVNKELNALARKGCIEIGRGSVSLRDVEALRALV